MKFELGLVSFESCWLVDWCHGHVRDVGGSVCARRRRRIGDIFLVWRLETEMMMADQGKRRAWLPLCLRRNMGQDVGLASCWLSGASWSIGVRLRFPGPTINRPRTLLQKKRTVRNSAGWFFSPPLSPKFLTLTVFFCRLLCPPCPVFVVSSQFRPNYFSGKIRVESKIIL